MAKQLTSEREAYGSIMESVRSVIGEKKWMIAVWCIDDAGDGKKIVKLDRRVTWQFPDGDYEKCVKFLQNSMKEELDARTPPVPPPLKMADFLLEKAGDENGEAKEKEERDRYDESIGMKKFNEFESKGPAAELEEWKAEFRRRYGEKALDSLESSIEESDDLTAIHGDPTAPEPQGVIVADEVSEPESTVAGADGPDVVRNDASEDTEEFDREELRRDGSKSDVVIETPGDAEK